MSTFNDLYDKLRTTIPTLTGFSDKTEIPNPVSLADNNAKFLRDGWGIKVGDNSPQGDDYLMPSVVESQDFEIVLTSEVLGGKSDVVPMITSTKALRDDIAAMEIDFTGSRFGIADKVENITVNSISGVESVTSEKKIITISVTFNFTYWR